MCPPGGAGLWASLRNLGCLRSGRGCLQAAIPSLPAPPWAPAGPGGPQDPISPPPGCAQARGALPVRLCLPVCVSVSVLDVVLGPLGASRGVSGSCVGKAASMSPWRSGGPLSSSQMVPRHQRGGCAAYRPLHRSPQGTAMTAVGRRQSVRPAGERKEGRGSKLNEAESLAGALGRGPNPLPTLIIFHPLAFPPSFQDCGASGGGWHDCEKL